MLTSDIDGAPAADVPVSQTVCETVSETVSDTVCDPELRDPAAV
jgi:hypothetical protein